MAQPPIVVDVRGMPDAITGINKATDALKALESRLDSIQQSSQSVFQKVFGQDATKTFRRFVTDINRLSDASADRFGKVADGLNLLSKAVRNLPKTDRSLSSLITDFQKFRTAIQGAALIDAAQAKKFQDFFRDINRIFLEASTIKPINAGVIRSITSLSSFLNAFNRIQDADTIQNARTNIDVILREIQRIFTLVNEGSEKANVTKLIGFSNDVIKSLNAMSKSIGSVFRIIQDSIPADSEERIDRFMHVLRTIRDEIFTISPLQTTGPNNQIRSINAITGIVTAVVRLSSIKADFDGLNKLAVNLKTFVKNLLAIDLEEGLSEDKIKTITAFINNIKKIIGLLSFAIDKDILTSGKNLVKVAQFLENLKFLVQRNLPELLQGIELRGNEEGLLKNMTKFTTLIRNLILSFKDLESVFASGDNRTKIEANILEFLRSITMIAEFINAKFVGFDQGVDEKIKLFSTTINTLVKSIKTIFDEIRDMPDSGDLIGRFKAFVKLRRFLSTASTIVREFSAIAASVDNVKDLASVGQSIKRFAGGIKTVFEESAKIPDIVDFAFNLKNVDDPLRALLKQFEIFIKLRLFLSQAKVIIRSLTKALAGVKNIEVVSKAAEAVARIARAVADLNRVRVSLPKRVDALQSLSAIFGIFSEFLPILQFVKRIARALSGFKVLKGIDLSGVAELIKTLVGLATDFTERSVTFPDLKNFVQFTDNLTKGLSNFVKIKGLNFGGINKLLGQLPFGQGKTRQSQNLNNAAGNFITSVFNRVKPALDRFIQDFSTLQDRIARGLVDAGRSVRDFGRNISQFGRDILRFFDISRLLQSQAISDVLEFDRISSQFAVFGGEVFNDPAVVSAMEDLAESVSVRFGVALNNSLEAALNLVKAGLDDQQIEFVLPEAAALSTLDPEAGIENTTKALIQAETVFADFTEGVAGTFENINIAADLIAAGADISTASIGSLSQGLRDVGTTAQEAGLNLQETVAALVAFERAGQTGSQGGRRLRAALSALTKESSLDALAAVGVEFQDEQGNIIPLDERIKALNDFFEEANATEAERFLFLKQLADVEGAIGISILLANDGIASTAEELEGLSSAQDRAAQATDNISGDIDKLKASFKSLIKDALRPFLQTFLRPILRFGKQIIDFFRGLPEPMIAAIVNAGVLAASVTAFVGAVAVAIGITTQFGGVLLQVAGNFLYWSVRFPVILANLAALAVSFLALSAIIVGLGAAFLLFGGIVAQVVSAVQNNLRGAGDAFNRFKARLGEIFEGVKELFKEIAQTISIFFGEGLLGQTERVGDEVATLFDRLSEIGGRVKVAISGLTELVRTFNLFNSDLGVVSVDDYRRALDRLSSIPFIQRLFGGNGPRQTAESVERFFFSMRRALQRFAQAIEDITGGFLGLLSGDPEAINRLKRGSGTILSLLSNLFQRLTGLDLSQAILSFDEGKIGEGIGKIIEALAGALRNFLVNNRDAIGNFVATLFNPFRGLGSALRGFGFDEVADVVLKLADAFDVLVNGALGIFFDLLEGKDIGTALTTNLGKVLVGLGEIVESSFLTELGAAFQTGDFGLVTTVIADALVNLFTGIVESIPTRLRELGDTLSVNFLDILTDIAEFGFSEERFNELLDTLAADISNLITSLPDRLRELGTTLNLGFLVDIGNALDTDLFKAIADVIGNLAVLPVDALVSLVEGVKVFIDEVTNLNPVAVGVLGLVLFQLRTFILGLAGSAITTILGPLAAVVTILSTVKAIGETLKNIGKQNNVFSVAIDFVRNFLLTITDLISPLLELLGIDPNQARTAVDQALTLFGGLFNYIFAQLYALIGDFIAKINIAIADILASVRISDPDQLNRIKSAFDSNVGQPLFDAIASSIGEGPTGSNLEALRSSLILNRDKIVQEALAIFNDPTALSALGGQERLNIFRVLEQAGLFDDVLGGLSDSQKAQFIESFANIFRTEGLAPELLGLDASATVDEIKAFLDSLNVNPLISESFLEIPIASRVEADQLRSEVETAIEEVEAADPVIEVRTEVLPPGRRRTRTGLEFLGGGFDRTPGRASGGKLQPYSTYEVHDTPNPEVATFADGRTLLFTGQAMGNMVNIVGRATAPAAESSSARALLDRFFDEEDGSDDEEDVITPKQARNSLKRLIKSITDTIKDIQENDADAREADAEAVRRFNQERLRDLQDFQIARLRAEEDGQGQILDAVATRNAAAARQSVEEQEKERRRAYEDQALKEFRRQEDLRLERANIEERRIERATELIARLAEQREEERQLNEIIAQGNSERVLSTEESEELQTIATQQGEGAQTAATQIGNAERSRLVGLSVAEQVAAMSQVGDVATALRNYVIDVATKVQTALNNLGIGLDFGLKKQPVKAAPIQQGGGTGGGGSPLPTPFARGGYTPTGGLALLHPREVVLPASAVRQPLSSNFYGGNRISNIINISVPGANMTADEIARSAIEIIVPELTQRMERAAAD